VSSRLTRQAYQKLVDEDLAWLKRQPPSLERDHIECILNSSVFYEYGPEEEPTAESWKFTREYHRTWHKPKD
jgi:hypothetical protein